MHDPGAKRPGMDEMLHQVERRKRDLEDNKDWGSKEQPGTPKDLGIRFLLDQFGELGTFWRHADNRVENALNLYLTGSTIIVSAVVLLAQHIAELQIFLAIAVFVAIPLASAAIVLAKRIADAEMIKAEYMYALDMIRRFFVDNAAEITPYLVLPFVVTPPLTEDGLTGAVGAGTSRILLTAIHLWAGLLLGFAVAGILWLVVPSASLVALLAGGILVAAASVGYLTIALKHEISTRATAIASRYRSQQESDANIKGLREG